MFTTRVGVCSAISQTETKTESERDFIPFGNDVTEFPSTVVFSVMRLLLPGTHARG